MLVQTYQPINLSFDRFIISNQCISSHTKINYFDFHFNCRNLKKLSDCTTEREMVTSQPGEKSTRKLSTKKSILNF